MSNQPFIFPPPPPPPPKRVAEGSYQQDPGYHNGRGTFRGNNSNRANIRGGRGIYSNYRGGSSGPVTSHASSHGQNFSHKPFNHGGQRGGSFNAPHKRDHHAAFKQTQQYHPRPTAPPPVPDFNASIQHLLTPKPLTRSPNEQSTSQKAPEPRRPDLKKHNLLGLTPAKFEQDSDPEDDEDEEQKLAIQTASAPGGHLFEYNGNPLTLRTREEILAWIAERKRRFPTEAKRLAAQKEFEEKRRLREEEMKVRLQAKREAEAKRDLERAERQSTKEQKRTTQERRHLKKPKKRMRKQSNESAPLDDAARAQAKAEKLRKKAFKAQQALEKAEEALRLVQAKRQEDSGAPRIPEADQAPGPIPLDTASDTLAAVKEDETSSSGSDTTDSDSDSASDSDDTSDSDAAPEVSSTKHPSHGYDSLPQPPRKFHDKNLRFCPYLAKYKSCKRRPRCHFSHDRSQNGRGTETADRNEIDTKKVATTASGNAKRKGLWQVMVDKEQEEERKRLLGAIIALGEKGMLDEPAQTSNGLS